LRDFTHGSPAPLFKERSKQAESTKVGGETKDCGYFEDVYILGTFCSAANFSLKRRSILEEVQLSGIVPQF
jgi:hypothetical protein